MRFFFPIFIFLSMGVQSAYSCKLWAICSKNGVSIPSMSINEKEMVNDELTSFYTQSESMAHGWAFLSYPNENQDSLEVWHRSPSPANNDSSLYWSVVDSMMEFESSSMAIGHLRLASSGTNSIPNPHPWLFYLEDKTYSLVHNGTLNKTLLFNLITQDSTDMSWLTLYPPNSFGNGDWMNEGWSSVVDSELLILFIMKMIKETDSIFDGLKLAYGMLIDSGVASIQLNTIFSDGESLYVYGGESGLSIADSDEHIVVMTTPATYNNTLSLNWDPLSSGELIIINESELLSFPNFANIEVEEPELPIPSQFSLLPPYPNPFNATVSIPYSLEEGYPMTLSIFSLLGEKVFERIFPWQGAKEGVLEWVPISPNQQSLSSGVYIVKGVSGQVSQSYKILFLK